MLYYVQGVGTSDGRRGPAAETLILLVKKTSDTIRQADLRQVVPPASTLPCHIVQVEELLV